MALASLKRALGLAEPDSNSNSLEDLRDLLEQRQTTLSLNAVYGRPYMDDQGEPTAVFPVTLYHDGERYGRTRKEFVVPDNGFDDTDSPLVEFLGVASGKNKDEITFEDLADVEGKEASADLNFFGDVDVEDPRP